MQRSHAPQPEGLLFLAPLIRSLITAQPCCRFLPKALKDAVVRACVGGRHAKKMLNKTGTPHDLFGRFVATRIGVVCAHLRQLRRNTSQEWEHACAKLDEEKVVQLSEIISLVNVTYDDLEDGILHNDGPANSLVDVGSPAKQGMTSFMTSLVKVVHDEHVFSSHDIGSC